MKTKINLIITILLTINLLTSCASMFWPNERKYEKVYNGMATKEFRSIHPKAINEYMDSFTTIFSITYYDTETKFVNSLDDAKYKKFYYFEDNKLVKVDKGERAVDYRIRVN
jgi:hypothetical protein